MSTSFHYTLETSIEYLFRQYDPWVRLFHTCIALLLFLSLSRGRFRLVPTRTVSGLFGLRCSSQSRSGGLGRLSRACGSRRLSCVSAGLDLNSLSSSHTIVCDIIQCMNKGVETTIVSDLPTSVTVEPPPAAPLPPATPLS